MTFEQLLYAKVLSHQPSMQAAADILHISKSGLSLAITQLEEELNVKIFERTNKGTILTPEGLQVLAAITEVLRAKNDLFSTAKMITHQQQNEMVRLYCVDQMPHAFHDVYINEFSKKYPDISVDMRRCLRSELLEKIKKEEVDAGLMSLPQELGDLGQELNFEPVCHTRIELICSKDHPLASKSQITLNDVKDLKFCMPHDESYDYVFNQMQYMCGPMSIVFRTDDCHLLKKAMVEMNAVSLIRAVEGNLTKSDWLNDMKCFSLGHLIDDNSILAWVYNIHRKYSNSTKYLMNKISSQIKTDTE